MKWMVVDSVALNSRLLWYQQVFLRGCPSINFANRTLKIFPRFFFHLDKFFFRHFSKYIDLKIRKFLTVNIWENFNYFYEISVFSDMARIAERCVTCTSFLSRITLFTIILDQCACENFYSYGKYIITTCHGWTIFEILRTTLLLLDFHEIFSFSL